jgi:Domain of unknown function (DUF4349)
MERSNGHSDLATALAETRPAPNEEFTRKLDKRVAAGFPRRSRLSGSPLSLLRDHLLVSGPGRLLFAGGGVVLVVIAVATVILAGTGSGTEQGRSGGLLNEFSGSSESTETQPQPTKPQATGSGGTVTPAPSAHAAEGSAAEGRSYAPAEIEEFSRGAGYDHTAAGHSLNFKSLAGRHRDIERSAEIGLVADPDDVADDSAAVFAAVHEAHGIVLRSTTTSGKRAGADFDLLIPSARLGDALAAFSAIDEVGSRHEATEDITAPTVSASEKLRDSRARIDGLLAQLSSAETETEMNAIEAELDRERHHASRLRSQLDKLEQRTEFSRVSVRIKTGASSTDSGGSWGIGDAFHDAGHILGIAAGVALIGLAVLAPLALIALLAWLAHRTWVRAQRRRALRDA